MPKVHSFARAAAMLGLVLLALSADCLPTAAAQTRARRFPPVERAQRTIVDLAAGVDAFKKDIGAFPKTLDELVTPARGTPHWHGPYYFGATVPLDPWGHPYHYNVPAKMGGTRYNLLSYGPDGEPGGGDDIVHEAR